MNSGPDVTKDSVEPDRSGMLVARSDGDVDGGVRAGIVGRPTCVWTQRRMGLAAATTDTTITAAAANPACRRQDGATRDVRAGATRSRHPLELTAGTGISDSKRCTVFAWPAIAANRVRQSRHSSTCRRESSNSATRSPSCKASKMPSLACPFGPASTGDGVTEHSGRGWSHGRVALVSVLTTSRPSPLWFRRHRRFHDA